MARGPGGGQGVLAIITGKIGFFNRSASRISWVGRFLVIVMFQDRLSNLGAVVGDKRLWRKAAEKNAAGGNTLRDHNVKHRQPITWSFIAKDFPDLHLRQSWSKPGRSECRERHLLPFDQCPSNKIVRPVCRICFSQISGIVWYGVVTSSRNWRTLIASSWWSHW